MDDSVKQNLIDKYRFADLFGTDVVKHAELFQFDPREFIVENLVRPDFLYYMVSGKVKLYDALANGKLALVDFFTPPCFIGEMELLDPDSEPFSVQVIETCYCLAIPVPAYSAQLLSDTVFLKHVCLYLAHKNAKNIKTASKNQGFTLSQRLAAFILLTMHDGHYDEKHTQVAEYLGVSYRHLLYVIAEFVKLGYLKKGQHGYDILSEADLQDVAREVTA